MHSHGDRGNEGLLLSKPRETRMNINIICLDCNDKKILNNNTLQSQVLPLNFLSPKPNKLHKVLVF